MKNKTNLFLDFDGTIANSIKAYCDVYNNKYKDYPEFIKSNPESAYEWDMQDICPLEEMPHLVFDQKEFFDNLEFIERNVDLQIQSLQEYYNVIICTIGTHTNIHYKSKWIEENLPFVKQAIYLVNDSEDGAIMDKSLPNMEGGIIVDDNIKNLHTSNASVKILFGKEYAFNIDNKQEYIRLRTWYHLYEYLLLLHKLEKEEY